MNIDVMRKRISDTYPGVGWKNRCQIMPTNQVVAIYNSLKKSGRLDNPVKEKGISYRQLTIFDFIGKEGVVNEKL